MSRRFALLSSLLLFGSLAWFLFGRDRPERGSTPAEVEVPTSARETAFERKEPVAPPVVESASTEDELLLLPVAAEPDAVLPDPAKTIAGRVIDEHRKGVPGLRVVVEEIRPTVMGRAQEEREPRSACTTDEEGLFTFTGLERRTWRVRVSGEKLGPRYRVMRDGIVPGGSALTIGVALGDRIQGTVVWPDESAVESFVVETRWGGRVYGTNGRFEFRSPMWGTCDLEVRASTPGFEGEASAHDVPVDGPPLHLVLAKTPLYALDGQVVDEAGEPLSAGSVTGYLEEAEFFARADVHSDGSFRLTGLRPGKWVLGVWAEGFLPLESEAVIDSAAAAPVRFVLSCAVRIRGRVVDGSLRPVPGATLFVDDGGVASTDAEGRFEFFRASEHVALRAEHGSLSSESVELDLAPGQVVEGVVLQLRAGWRLRGKLLDEAGVPVAGLHVTAVAPGWACVAETDEAGSFVMRSFHVGRVEVRAVDPALGRRTSAPVVLAPGGNTEVTLRFAPRAPLVLRGRVTLNGLPVERALTFVHPSFLARAMSDVEGRFEITVQTPGAWHGYVLDGSPEVRGFELEVRSDVAELELALETMPLAESLDELTSW